MHKDRFDAWTTGFASSRRGALRLVAGGALGAVLAQLGLGAVAAACKQDGALCDKNKDQQCCSGSCRKSGGGKFRCRKVKGAFGCTNQKATDTCEGNPFACPEVDGGLCFVDQNGRPGCADNQKSKCFDCASDAECVAETNILGAKCVTGCQACGNDNNRFCAAPVQPD